MTLRDFLYTKPEVHTLTLNRLVTDELLQISPSDRAGRFNTTNWLMQLVTLTQTTDATHIWDTETGRSTPAVGDVTLMREPDGRERPEHLWCRGKRLKTPLKDSKTFGFKIDHRDLISLSVIVGTSFGTFRLLSIAPFLKYGDIKIRLAGRTDDCNHDSGILTHSV